MLIPELLLQVLDFDLELEVLGLFACNVGLAFSVSFLKVVYGQELIPLCRRAGFDTQGIRFSGSESDE